MSGPPEASARRAQRGSTRSDELVVIIPAYNEASNLPALLSELAAQEPHATVIVVDDGSRDDTADAATRAGAHVMRHPFNLGYGAALQTGYRAALERGAQIAVQLDADGQHPVSAVAGLVDLVRSGQCDLAVGSRFLEPNDYEMGAIRSIGRAVFRAAARLGGLSISDPTSGLQAMNRSVLELFALDWYPHDYPDVDVLLVVHRSGLRIRELPVAMGPGVRASLLHSGWRPFYYVYKMLLSLWSIGAVTRGRARSGPVEGRNGEVEHG